MRNIIIENVNGWGIGDKPEVILKTNKFFKDLGFKSVQVNKYIADVRPNDKLTLLFRPNGMDSVTFDDLDVTQLKITYPNWHNRDIKKRSLGDYMEAGGVLITYNGQNIGFYERDNNLVVILFNIPYLSNFDKNEGEFIFKILEENVKTLKIQEIKIDKKGRLIKLMLKNFENRKNDLTTQITQCGNDIKRQIENISDYDRRIQQSNFELSGLNNFLKNSNKILDREIKGITQLPFIKNLKFTLKGIEYEEKNIKIVYEGVTIPMGNFKILLNGNKIDITSNKRVCYSNSNTYNHPHVSSSSICFGNNKEKVYSLLNQMRLKELAILIHIFLSSYNPNDKYLDICYFKKAYVDGLYTHKKINNYEVYETND